MALPVPNLDDRRWAELVRDARALIPIHAPGWTDHNVHDPGITLVELLAWLTEANIYALNRIGDAHLREFLGLVGITPEPPAQAEAVVAFSSRVARDVPANVEIEAAGGEGQIAFRTLESLAVHPGRLCTVQVRGPHHFRDVTASWEHGESIPLLGRNPVPGAALYLGFDRPLTTGRDLSIVFQLTPHEPGATHRSGPEERDRLHEAEGERHLAHHSAVLTWEYLDPSGRWHALTEPEGVLFDTTRGLTLDGRVRLRLPPGASVGLASLGDVDTGRHYIRCRLVRGAFDAPPTGRFVPGAVRALQAVPTRSVWEISPAASAPVADAPVHLEPGHNYRLNLGFAAPGPHLARGIDARVEELSLADTPGADQPALHVLSYLAPSGNDPGRVEIEAEWLGRCSGRPGDEYRLGRAPAAVNGFGLFTIEDGRWNGWERRPDLFGSRRPDRHFVLDSALGVVTFGDGQRGYLPPADAELIAVYRHTEGAAANLVRGSIRDLTDNAHNRILLSDFDDVAGSVEIRNPWPASGGTNGEALEDALGRAFTVRDERTRAVTLADFEHLARQTPGTRIARVAARPNVHPDYPCYEASGIVTVVVIPFLPTDSPRPSGGLVRTVQAYLDRRTILGTRAVVTGPRYRRVTVQAEVRAHAGADRAAIPARTSRALDEFFHPLRGGSDESGWPIGRDVYRSEVLQVIDETPGVEHVVSLTLISDGSEPSCGNVCLAPCELVGTGTHQIEVVS